MLKLVEDGDFAISALGICSVLKGVKYLFESVLAVGTLFKYSPDVPVGTTAQQLPRLVVAQYMFINFLAHLWKLPPIITINSSMCADCVLNKC